MNQLRHLLSNRRRGSVLVVVVGVLALISVLAIVYVAVGRQDLRTRAGVQTQKALVQPAEEVRDYITQIITDDVLSFTWDQVPLASEAGGVLANLSPSYTREASDYPFTLPGVVSYSIGGANDPLGGLAPNDPRRGIYLFNPVGSLPFTQEFLNLRENQLPLAENFRLAPSDPFLAAIEPTYLNFDSELDPAALPDVEAPYTVERLRDWTHVSNVAPDGLFVNLWALRGNFNAQPGFGDDANGRARLSKHLSLYDNTSLQDTSTEIGAFGLMEPFQNTSTDFDLPLTGGASNAYRVRPFVWTARQRNAARASTVTAADPGVESPLFKLYSWADADGDGILDSRWFQMTDSSLGPDNTRQLFNFDSKYRYFFAVRIIDASGLINVNTAGDHRAGPTREIRLGSPADIDLLTRLAGTHVFERYAPLDAAGNPQPGLRAGHDGGPNPDLTIAGVPPEERPQFYAAESPNAITQDADSDIAGGFDRTRAASVGQTAYDALRLALARGAAPDLYRPGDNRVRYQGDSLLGNLATDFGLATFSAPPQEFGLGRERWDFATADPNSSAVYRRHWSYVQAASRYFSTLAAGVDPYNAIQRADTFQYQGNFGLESMLELNTFRALNNYASISSLEKTLDGRDNRFADSTGLSGSSRFGQMRSNRPETDRTYGPDVRNNDNLSQLVPDGKTDPEFFRQLNADVRHAVTTLSSSRPLASMSGINPTVLEARRAVSPIDSEFRQYDFQSPAGDRTISNVRLGEVRQNADELVQYLYKRLDSASLAGVPGANAVAQRKLVRDRFKSNLQALHAFYVTVFDGSPSYQHQIDSRPTILASLVDAKWNEPSNQTLFYGHSPEAALRVAAAMAVNAADMRDMDRPAVRDATNDPANPENPATPPIETIESTRVVVRAELDDFPAGLVAGGEQLLDSERIVLPAPLSLRGDFADIPDLLMYGIEPQPFVSQVAVYTTFRDTGDDEGTSRPANFKGRVCESNDDFMYRVLAFRLVNPFDFALDETYLDSLIIRFAGQSYTFDVSASDRLEAYSSRVFYALSQPITDATASGSILERFNGAISQASLVNVIENPLGRGPVTSAAPFTWRVQNPLRINAAGTATFNQFFVDRDDTPLEVQLWRKRPTAPIAQGSTVDVGRDLLLDRMRLPVEAHTVLHEGTQFTTDCSAQQDILNSEAHRTDEIVMTTFASYSRPVDLAAVPVAGSTIVRPLPLPVGVLPAFCIEPKDAGIRPWNFLTPAAAPTDTRNTSPDYSGLVQRDTGLVGGQDVGDWVSNMTAEPPLPSMARNPAFPAADTSNPGMGGLPADWLTTDGVTDPVIARSLAANTRKRTEYRDTAFPTQYCISLPSYKADILGDAVTGVEIDASGNRTIVPAKHPRTRPGDMLLPLAIAPTFNFTDWTFGSGPDAEVAWRWATLGEIAATSLGYFNPTNISQLPNFDNDPVAIYVPQVVDLDGPAGDPPAEFSMLDRGQVRLDAYVPFKDLDEDGNFNSDLATNPNSPSNPEIAAGNAAPLAMRVFDLLQSYDPSLEVDADRGAPGVLNINTAPLSNLSVLPMLAPPTSIVGLNEERTIQFSAATGTFQVTFGGNTTGPVPVAGGEAILEAELEALPDIADVSVRSLPIAGSGYVIEFVGADGQRAITTSMTVAGPTSGTATVTRTQQGRRGVGETGWYAAPFTPQVDIASTMFAYREKGLVQLRQPSFASIRRQDERNPGDAPVIVNAVDFTELPAAPEDLLNLASWSARSRVCGIPAITEAPGFRTLSELIGVRARIFTPNWTQLSIRWASLWTISGAEELLPRTYGARCNIDFLGHDLAGGPDAPLDLGNPRLRRPAESSTLGVTSTYYQARRTHPTDSPARTQVLHATNAVPNSYDEQLAVINGLSDTITNRSDVFIAWFVVHGYSEQDCQMTANNPNVPLVPSIARRFLMVVDRSKVTQRGQKAQVLLFKEVPYSPFQ